MVDVVTARANYSKLDEANFAVRIRLNSTVVHVQHVRGAKPARTLRSRMCAKGSWSACRPGSVCSRATAE